MDKLKGFAEQAASKMGNKSGGNNPQGQGQPQGGQGGNPGQEDYGDKGLDYVEGRTGHHLSREQNEKITDGARNFIESKTGKNIPDKFSN